MKGGSSDRRFWCSYILFIIIIGGILVLFIYITSLVSNEIFSPSNKIHREVSRAKDLSAPMHHVPWTVISQDLCTFLFLWYIILKILTLIGSQGGQSFLPSFLPRFPPSHYANVEAVLQFVFICLSTDFCDSLEVK